MQTILYQGKKVAYSCKGKGSALVFIHGFCADSRMWDDFAPLFPNHKFICVDLPGFGQSELQHTSSIEEMAATVFAVLKHLKIASYVLIGHSMGGYVILMMAQQNAAQLKGLCLFHSHPFADTDEKKVNRQKSIDFIHRNGHIHFVKQLIPTLFSFDFSKGYQFEVNKLIFNASKYKPEGIIAALNAMMDRPDQSETLKNLEVPVLFIIGKEDAAIPHELNLEQIHLPKQADIQILSAVGHMGMFEAKQKTNKIIRNYLSDISF